MPPKPVDLLQGTLDLLILKAASLGPMHGYGILLRIGQVSGEQLVIQQGALYPALHRLEVAGALSTSWAASDNNRRAKFYALTPRGENQLAEETARFSRMARVVTAFLRATADASIALPIPAEAQA